MSSPAALAAWLSGPGWLGTGAPRMADLLLLGLGAVLLALVGAPPLARRGGVGLHAAMMAATLAAVLGLVGLMLVWRLAGATGGASAPAPPRALGGAALAVLAVHVPLALGGLAAGLVALLAGWGFWRARSAGVVAVEALRERHRRRGRLARRLLYFAAASGATLYALRFLL